MKQRIINFFSNPGMGFFLLPIIAFLPLFWGNYAYHNDYYRWDYPVGDHFPEFEILLWEGRPIGAYLLSLHFLFIPWDIEAFWYSRVFAFLIVMTNGLIIAGSLQRFAKISRQTSILIGSLFVMLPSGMLNTLWATNLVPGHIGTLFSLLSFLILNLTTLGILRYPLSGIMYIFTLWTYPPAGMMVFTLLGGAVLFCDKDHWKEIRKSIVYQALFFMGMMFVYMVVTKFIYFPILYANNESIVILNERMKSGKEINYTWKLIGFHQLAEKVLLFVHILYYFFLNMVIGLNKLTAIVKGFLAILIGFALFRIVLPHSKEERNQSGKRYFFERVASFVTLYIIVNAPFLVTLDFDFGLIGFRMVGAIQLAMLLLVVSIFYHARKFQKVTEANLLNGLALLLFTLGIFTVGYYVSENNRRELSIADKQIASDPDACQKKFWVVMTNSEGYTNVDLPLDFGHTATLKHSPLSAFFNRGAHKFCNKTKFPVAWFPVENYDHIHINRDLKNQVSILDLRAFREKNYWNFVEFSHAQMKDLFGVDLTKAGLRETGRGGLRFDSERNGNVSIQIEFSNKYMPESYTMTSEEYPERMPVQWIVEGKNRGMKEWIRLQTKELHQPWRANESKSFGLENSEPFELVRIVFLSESSTKLEGKLYLKGVKLQKKIRTVTQDRPIKAPQNNPERLFDHERNNPRFWEQYGSFPVKLNLEYSTPVAITAYALERDKEFFERMVIDWDLLASNDGKIWSRIDHRSFNDWPKQNLVVCKIKNETKYKYYKLKFNKTNTNSMIRVGEIYFPYKEDKEEPLSELNIRELSDF